jgi:hypothetical protein
MWMVILKQEYVVVGQRIFEVQIRVFFPFGEHIDPQVEYTG